MGAHPRTHHKEGLVILTTSPQIKKQVSPECPVCLEPTPDPLLPCGHSLCGACKTKMSENCNLKDECPKCRHPFNGEQTDFGRDQQKIIARQQQEAIARMKLAQIAVEVGGVPGNHGPPGCAVMLGMSPSGEPEASIMVRPSDGRPVVIIPLRDYGGITFVADERFPGFFHEMRKMIEESESSGR